MFISILRHAAVDVFFLSFLVMRMIPLLLLSPSSYDKDPRHCQQGAPDEGHDDAARRCQHRYPELKNRHVQVCGPDKHVMSERRNGTRRGQGARPGLGGWNLPTSCMGMAMGGGVTKSFRSHEQVDTRL